MKRRSTRLHNGFQTGYKDRPAKYIKLIAYTNFNYGYVFRAILTTYQTYKQISTIYQARKLIFY